MTSCPRCGNIMRFFILESDELLYICADCLTIKVNPELWNDYKNIQVNKILQVVG